MYLDTKALYKLLMLRKTKNKDNSSEFKKPKLFNLIFLHNINI